MEDEDEDIYDEDNEDDDDADALSSSPSIPDEVRFIFHHIPVSTKSKLIRLFAGHRF